MSEQRLLLTEPGKYQTDRHNIIPIQSQRYAADCAQQPTYLMWSDK